MGKPKQERKPTKDPNTVTLGGRMTRDPKEHGKTAVFGLAVHNIERVDGEPIEVTFFPEVTAFEPAKHILRHGKKGKRVLVTGTLVFDEYEAKDDTGGVIYRDEAEEKPVMKQAPRILTSSIQYL